MNMLKYLINYLSCINLQNDLVRTIVSLNYDLILHSIRMYGNDAIKDGHVFKDGFSDDGVIFNRWDYLKDPYYKSSYEKEVTRAFYQHGNLSIFRFANGIERKVKRKFNSDLLETIEENWTDQSIPIFVAEGTSDKKWILSEVVIT